MSPQEELELKKKQLRLLELEEEEAIAAESETSEGTPSKEGNPPEGSAFEQYVESPIAGLAQGASLGASGAIDPNYHERMKEMSPILYGGAKLAGEVGSYATGEALAAKAAGAIGKKVFQYGAPMAASAIQSGGDVEEIAGSAALAAVPDVVKGGVKLAAKPVIKAAKMTADIIGEDYRKIKDAFTAGINKIKVHDPIVREGISKDITAKTRDIVRETHEGLKSVIDTARENKSSILRNLDKQVSIDPREVVKIRSANSIKALQDSMPIGGYYDKFKIQNKSPFSKAETAIKMSRTFDPAVKAEKTKILSEINQFKDNFMFKDGEKGKRIYNNFVTERTKKLEETLDNALSELDPKEFQKIEKQLLDEYQLDLENEFVQKARTIKPSDIEVLKKDVYRKIDYDTAQQKVFGQRTMVTESPGYRSAETEEALKQWGRDLDSMLDDLAEEYGHNIKKENEIINNTLKMKKLAPTPEQHYQAMTSVSSTGEPEKLNSIIDQLENMKIQARENEATKGIADALDEMHGYIFKKNQLIKSMGSRTNRISNMAGSLYPKNTVDKVFKGAEKVYGSQITAQDTEEDMSRTPQSVSNPFDRRQVALDLAQAKIPRNSMQMLDNKEVVLSKVLLEIPEAYEQVSSAYQHNPSSIGKILGVLAVKRPDMFEEDKFGRIDSLVPKHLMRNYIESVRTDRELSNTERMKIIDDVVKTGRGEYTPSNK